MIQNQENPPKVSGPNVRRIVIVGGGTAGWMSAALMSKFLGASGASITLVESEAIGTIGVGEATIPYLKNFNDMLGIDEAEFLKSAQATYKLGIEFVDWGRLGERYLHPFGEYGIPIHDLHFHHVWNRSKELGEDFPLGEYCLNVVAAKSGKFMRPIDDPTSLASRIPYAYHLDAVQYAAFLRAYAEKLGTVRIEGRVVNVDLNSETGHIETLSLESGQTIQGDLFIDCSGFRAILIEGALKAGYDDWSDLLPMDSAVTAHSAADSNPLPYTVATAREAGWTWRIPLQTRTGNGHVYSSQYMDGETAKQLLLDNMVGDPVTDLRHLFFKAGRRRVFWKNNCLALGLASGFLEPLESTSIHLVQEGLIRFIALMPTAEFNPVNAIEYNRVMGLTYERIRDFILLHYAASDRDDTAFWQYIRSLDLPEILAHRMTLLEEAGHFVTYEHDLFKLDSWLAVMIGQGRSPKAHNAVADGLDTEAVKSTLGQLRRAIREIVKQMPEHGRYIRHVIDGA